MLNVAIIGSNGFIGTHLADIIFKYKDLSLFLFGKNKNNLSGVDTEYNVIDSSNQELTKKQFKSIDIVFYLASSTIPSTSWINPKIELEQNLLPFINFMECISDLNVKKIIFVSSAGTIYGPTESKATESSEKQPFSPYGIIKLTIEHFLNYFKLKHNISFDIYRVSNVYGEGQNTSKGLGIINTFIENIIKNQQVHIYGNGNNIRNYIHVKDVVNLISYSIKSDFSKSNIFNIGSNDTLSINELIAILQTIVDEKFEVIYSPNRKSDNPIIDIDNSKILNSVPNYKFIPIEIGIQKLYSNIKNHIKK